MIRFRVDNLTPEAASLMDHPSLRRLAGRGPWACVADAGGTILTRGTAAAWGPWTQGLGGLSYSLADPLPEWSDAWLADLRGATLVPLRCGVVLPVLPVPYDGLTVDLMTGAIGAPVSRYGQAVAEAFDLLAGDLPVPAGHPTLVDAAREILLRSTNLPLEALAALRLVGTDDFIPLIEGAAGIPKAACGAGGCAAAPPASIPPA
jgi:hypothetical protein